MKRDRSGFEWVLIGALLLVAWAAGGPRNVVAQTTATGTAEVDVGPALAPIEQRLDEQQEAIDALRAEVDALMDDAALVDFTLDGAAVDTDDFYSASETVNSLFTHTGVVVIANADGVHTLRGTVNGKNASSTGYRVDISHITLIEE